MTDDEWKDDTTHFFKPHEKGQQIVGTPVGTEQTDFGEAVKIELQDTQDVAVGEEEVVELQAGEEVLVNYTAVNDFLQKHLGDLVKLEYTGLKENDSGMEYKNFDRKWK